MYIKKFLVNKKAFSDVAFFQLLDIFSSVFHFILFLDNCLFYLQY